MAQMIEQPTLDFSSNRDLLWFHALLVPLPPLLAPNLSQAHAHTLSKISKIFKKNAILNAQFYNYIVVFIPHYKGVK